MGGHIGVAKASTRLTLALALLIISAFIAAIITYYDIVAPENPLQTSTRTASTSTTSTRSIRLVVIVDNNPYNRSLKTAWGIAVYVEAFGRRILFDTGPDMNVLKYNAEKLGIKLADIDFIVISHEHGDHVGGLPLFSKLHQKLHVYIPSGSPWLKHYVESLGLKPIVVEHTTSVSPGVYIVGPLYGPPYEQALAIKTAKGLIVVVGCSHPGADKIAEKALKELGTKPFAIVGGFHLIGASKEKVEDTIDRLVEMGFRKIYPIHCSGEEARRYLEIHYPDRYGDGGVGLEIIVED